MHGSAGKKSSDGGQSAMSLYESSSDPRLFPKLLWWEWVRGRWKQDGDPVRTSVVV